jgi:hypothetical protein
MIALTVGLLLLALVMFLVAALFIPDPFRWRFMALGLAAWVLSEIIAHYPLK